MGRHKTKIEYIADERMRQLMFLKRKQAINRKLWEISVVCGVECLAVYFASNGKMFAFSSTGNLDDTMLRYCGYDEPHEVRTVADYERFSGEDPPATEYDHMLRHPPRANAASAHAPPAMATGPLPARTPTNYQHQEHQQQQQQQQSVPFSQEATSPHYQPPPLSQQFQKEPQQHQQSAPQPLRPPPLTGSFAASRYQAHPPVQHQHPLSATTSGRTFDPDHDQPFSPPVQFPPHPTYQQHPDMAVPLPQTPFHEQYRQEHRLAHELHLQQPHRPAPLAPSSYCGSEPLKSAPVLASSSSANPLWSPPGWQQPGAGSAPTSQHRDAFPPTPVNARGFDNPQNTSSYPPPTGMGAGGYHDQAVVLPESASHPVPTPFEPSTTVSESNANRSLADNQSSPRQPLTLAHPRTSSNGTPTSSSPWIHSPPPTARHSTEWPATSAASGAVSNAMPSPAGAIGPVSPRHWSHAGVGTQASPASHPHHPIQQDQPSFASGSNRAPSGLKLTIPSVRSPSAFREHPSGPNSAGASPNNPRKRARVDGPDMFITPPTSGRVLPPPVVLLEPHHGAGAASSSSNDATSTGLPQQSQHHFYQQHQHYQHPQTRPWPEAGGPQSAPALTGPPPTLPLPAHEARAMMINRASDPPYPDHGAASPGEWRSGE